MDDFDDFHSGQSCSWVEKMGMGTKLGPGSWVPWYGYKYPGMGFWVPILGTGTNFRYQMGSGTRVCTRVQVPISGTKWVQVLEFVPRYRY